MDEWISVEDRLPENLEDVLCWYEYFRYGNYNRTYKTFGIGYCVNGNWGGGVMNGTNNRVLYWMPLPEPPKEDVNMSLDNITALVWIFVAGYALSVLQSIKRTSDFVKTEVQKMCEEEN